MSHNNPFEIVFVITAIMIVVGGAIGIIAPSLGATSVVAPTMPSFPSLDVQGNLTATYPFDETHNCTSGHTLSYTDFNPDKQVVTSGTGIAIQIPGWLGLWWDTEPSYYINGTQTGALYAQTIVNNANGTSSYFIVHLGSNQYQAYVKVSPIAGYATLTDSWNIGHGFTVRIYGSVYTPLSWTDQASAYLTFAGSIIGYVLYFIWYMISIVGVLLVLMGLSPVLAGGAVILAITLFIGSLLLFLRGTGDATSGGK